MIMWIILGYLAASIIASLVFYAACIVSARADRTQHQFSQEEMIVNESETVRTKPATASRLALSA